MTDQLAKLRELIDASSARVRIGYPFWLRPFLQKGVIGITLGRNVYLSQRLFERQEEELQRIVRHELAHVRQVRQLGLFRFLFRYLAEYVRLRRSGMASSAAYDAISFEREALAAENGESVTKT